MFKDVFVAICQGKDAKGCGGNFWTRCFCPPNQRPVVICDRCGCHMLEKPVVVK